uniref:Delta(3,5)-Delta(2,4)-dienoyl-CoA isomerase, mitochondrial n=1 Tax=Anthurium amnicola TaxID=1678845 RepID=A0A1D1YKD7_9ARAE
MQGFRTVEIVKDPAVPVFHIYLNRPAHRNALTLDSFSELPRALTLLDQDPSARAVVLAARGPHFCTGIDLSVLRSLGSAAAAGGSDPARAREHLRRQILSLQAAITAIERCRKPVIAAVHGACVGGGVDIVTACDLRYCTADAFFSVKEVDVGLAADVGTLQRLPAIVGYGNASEMALTGRSVPAAEARAMGLVSAVFETREEMEKGVAAVARDVAAKSPLAVTGTKAVLLRCRDLTVDQGLDYVATWNSAMLISDDLKEAVEAQIQKRKPTFAKL